MQMKALQATEHIWWVGALDPDLRIFDIVMRSDYGTTYNSYLLKGSEKTALFETVKEKFFEEHLEKIRQVIDPAQLDYIVVNHTEPDHSGSVAKLLELAPNATVLGSQTAISFLKEIVNKPFRHQAVTEKDQIDLGGLTLNFLSAPMLHWPDHVYLGSRGKGFVHLRQLRLPLQRPAGVQRPDRRRFYRGLQILFRQYHRAL